MAPSLGGGCSGKRLWIAARAYWCSDCVRGHLPRRRDNYRLCGPFRGSEVEGQMIRGTNERGGVDAGFAILLAIGRAQSGTTHRER